MDHPGILLRLADGRAVTGAGGWIRSTIRAVVARYRARATREALAGLDAHTLRDIGVSYSDVKVLATWGTEGVRTTRHRVIHPFEQR